MKGHSHHLQLLALDEKVRRLRNTAANFDWDCRSLLKEIESLDRAEMCEVLQRGFDDLKNAVHTMNESMAIMGNNMMGVLNAIAVHLTSAHVEAQMRKAQAEALGRTGGEDTGEDSGEEDPTMEEMH